MRVAALVPHWNRRDLLEQLIQSLSAQERRFDEIIIADNGSTDGSAELAASLGARVLKLGRNLGFAAAVNRGIEACQADWVAILNNDVTLAPGWLATLLAAAEHAPERWFAVGKLLRADNPATLDGAFDAISRGACACRCGSGKADSSLWNQGRCIQLAPMTAALFRRGLFDEVGALDEAFESFLEDVDFGLRCALGGRGGLYVPSAVAFHRGSSTLGRWHPDTVRRLSRNQVLLAAKHFRGQPWWPIVAGQLLWGLIAIRHATGMAYVRGKLSGLRAVRNKASDHTPDPAHIKALREILEGSERDIFEIEQQAGFDWYWRAYFWLLPR